MNEKTCPAYDATTEQPIGHETGGIRPAIGSQIACFVYVA
jgi:hypothetical protein